jgi:hypothetical protein
MNIKIILEILQDTLDDNVKYFDYNDLRKVAYSDADNILFKLRQNGVIINYIPETIIKKSGKHSLKKVRYLYYVNYKKLVEVINRE